MNETIKNCDDCKGSGLDGGENMFNDRCETCKGDGLVSSSAKPADGSLLKKLWARLKKWIEIS